MKRGDVLSAARSAVRTAFPLALVALLATALVLTTAASGGFTAKVQNVGNAVQAGSLLTSATSGAVTECDLGTAANSPIAAGNAALCSGSPGPGGTLPGTGTAAVSTVVADHGSLAATAAKMTKSTCGAVQLANAKTAADPMLVRGSTIGYGQPGPLTSGTSLSLSGGSAYAAEVKSAAAATTFTELIWFKTAANGTLMGFTNSPTTTSPTSWDRMLWVDATGHVVFGVTSGSSVEVVSPAATYLNNGWHLAAGTVSSAGMVLTIDGVAVATNASTKTATSYTGYWHAGWDNENTSWTDPPANPYFNGLLANAAIFPPLTTAQIAALYAAGTQATWTTLLTSDGTTNSWTLGDNGTTAFTGTIPNVTPNACAFVDVTIGTASSSSRCAAPSSASACVAPTSSLTLSSLAATVTFALLPTPSQSLTMTETLARDGTNTVAAFPYAAGLHLTTSLAVVASNGSFNATLTWVSQNVVL
jgi:Concanavalin A-like lectin/glucanases superfamily